MGLYKYVYYYSYYLSFMSKTKAKDGLFSWTLEQFSRDF